MKKILLLLLLTAFGLPQALSAQDYEYTPFVREGVQWVCTYRVGSDLTFRFTLELKGEVLIDGIKYKPMYKYSGDKIDPVNDSVLVYLREEDKVVYGIVPGGKLNKDYTIGIDGDDEMVQNIKNGKEFVLYDFREPIRFIERWSYVPYLPRTVIQDKMIIAGKTARRFISYFHGSFCSLEGIGYDGFQGWYPLGYDMRLNLSHVIDQGQVIYRSEQYCNTRPGRNELLQIAREGPQWINEKVIISKGDTTRYYYTYEFKGENFRGHPICYYYTGNVLNPNQAEPFAKFQTPYGYLNFTCMVYDNRPFTHVIEAGRDMIGYGSANPNCLPLYQFSQTESQIDMNDPINYYIINQREEFLTRENFKEVEPLEIEGMKCRRYAYLGEDGEPLAYIVEGIGFDSRDMGDLLTPFTRQPDPNADYQEYCGLSHVIKDGEIIYKGLRYDASRVEGVPGDVNGDGTLSIDDVTSMIDLLLRGGNELRLPSDLDSNGRLTIDDVTLLIDKLLSGE